MDTEPSAFLLLFDMDGVLLDSATAITGSLHYALHKNGFRNFSNQDLTHFVGPPLSVMLDELLPDVHQDIRDQCAIDYRIHNNLHGPELTAVYEGVQELLEDLSRRFELRVATSKLESAAELVLRAKSLDHLFSGIHGSNPDGSDSKTDVMQRALQSAKDDGQLSQPLAMIGDRKHDVESAKNLGINSIGVTWGYAPTGELEAASPSHMVSSPQQLKSLIYQLADLET
jgi:phosphoglycolate phosphatase